MKFENKKIIKRKVIMLKIIYVYYTDRLVNEVRTSNNN